MTQHIALLERQDQLALAMWCATFFVVYACGWLGVSVLLVVPLAAFAVMTTLKRRRVRLAQQLIAADWHKYWNAETLKRLLIPHGDPAALPAWVRYRQCESARWLNATIEALWPFVKRAAANDVIASTNKVFKTVCPSVLKAIELSEFSLGDTPPLITGVSGKSDGEGVTLEFDVRFVASNSRVVVDAVAPTPAGRVALSAKLGEIEFSGKLRVQLLNPCIKWPCFRQVSISFVEQPRVDFDLIVLKGLNVMSLGPLTSAIRGVINDALHAALVWPTRVIVPISEGDTIEARAKPEAVLQVELIGGDDLRKADSGFSSKLMSKSVDPFVSCYVGPARSSFSSKQVKAARASAHKLGARVYKSAVRKKSPKPEWNETFSLPVFDVANTHVNFDVYDFNLSRVHDWMGSCSVQLSLLSNEPREAWVDLTGAKSGQLHMRLTLLREDDQDYVPPIIQAESESQESMPTLETATTMPVEDDTVVTSKGVTLETAEVASPTTEQTHQRQPSATGRASRLFAPLLERRHTSKLATSLLTVTVIRASDLIAADRNGTSDPYLTLVCGNERRKTTTKKKTLSPEWNEQFEFHLNDPSLAQLRLLMRDKDRFGKDELIGEASIALQDVISSGGRLRQSFALDNVTHGEIELDLALTDL
ncbi:MAG: hypothetical protein MHM6MM_001593 [Cercozoa sp. M6MM]